MTEEKKVESKVEATVKSKLLAKAPEAGKPGKIKMMVFSKSGIGKTWLSMDFPKPYYIDCEGGARLAHYQEKLAKAGGERSDRPDRPRNTGGSGERSGRFGHNGGGHGRQNRHRDHQLHEAVTLLVHPFNGHGSRPFV